MAYVIGLTGGIGSGKTTVSNLFKKLGVPIIDADVIAHEMTQKNTSAYEKIREHFGDVILDANKAIDRQKLKELVFNNLTEKKWLENLLHPLIRQTMRDALQKMNAPYCICVIPLLAESSSIVFLNRILVVDTLPELQLSRARERDKANDALIQKIINGQAKRDERLKIADDIIENNGDLSSLEKKVLTLHQQYIKKIT